MALRLLTLTSYVVRQVTALAMQLVAPVFESVVKLSLRFSGRAESDLASPFFTDNLRGLTFADLTLCCCAYVRQVATLPAVGHATCCAGFRYSFQFHFSNPPDVDLRFDLLLGLLLFALPLWPLLSCFRFYVGARYKVFIRYLRIVRTPINWYILQIQLV